MAQKEFFYKNSAHHKTSQSAQPNMICVCGKLEMVILILKLTLKLALILIRILILILYVSDIILPAVDSCSEVNTCFEGVKPACNDGIPQLCLVIADSCKGVPFSENFFICKKGTEGM